MNGVRELKLVWYWRIWSKIRYDWYMRIFHPKIHKEVKACFKTWKEGL